MKCVEITTMSKEEWDELFALKSAISYNPASVATRKMELFTELLVKSLEFQGEDFIEPKNLQTAKY
jgi:hypothetical protein